jgi:hypothetical protein
MGLIRGVARTAVVAGTASAVAGRVQRRQQRKWGAQDAAAAPPQEAPQQQEYAAPPPPAAEPAPEPSGGGDLVAQLQQLDQLHQQGVLNDQEFAAAKAKLLGG